MKYQISFDNDCFNETCTIALISTRKLFGLIPERRKTFKGHSTDWFDCEDGSPATTSESLTLNNIWKTENNQRLEWLKSLEWTSWKDKKWGSKIQDADVLRATGGLNKFGSTFSKEIYRPFADRWHDCDTLDELTFDASRFFDKILKKTDLAARLEREAKVVNEPQSSAGHRRSYGLKMIPVPQDGDRPRLVDQETESDPNLSEPTFRP